MSNAASTVIAKCQGHANVAKVCGIHVTNVYRWTYPAEKGGTDGVIPSRHQKQLLAWARGTKADLRPEDFFDRAEPITAQPLAETARAAG